MPASTRDKTGISTWTNWEMKELVRREAKARGQNQSDVVETALKEYFDLPA